ncbi:MAG: diguanylate cyclase [Pseudomonadota bacterium]
MSVGESLLPLQLPARSERVALRELLAAPASGRLRLPDDLEREYGNYHHAIALHHLRSYWPLVVAAVVAIAALTFVSGVAEEALRPLVAFGFAVMFAVIGMVIAAALWPPLQARLTAVVGLAAFIGLLAMHEGTLLAAAGTPLRAMAEYGVVFITVAAFSISCLPFRDALFWSAAALTGLLATVALTGLQPDWNHFFFYGIGSLLIAAILGFSQEIRERTVFLQERLLALEKQELDALTHELSLLSRRDALTGLANRRHFDEVLAREWATCVREGVALNLVFVDVDHFKHYNDHYGHPAGDECLRRVGHALGTQALRGADFVARYGGEEFVALFPRTSREGLEIIARRIVDAVDALALPHAASAVYPQVTVSVGVASLTPDRDNAPADLVRLADAALYRAKRDGRHRYVTSWSDTTA